MASAVNVIRLHWMHWSVIGLSSLLTFSAWYISNTQIEQKIQERFESQSSQLIAQVSERMNRYENALRTGVVAIHTQNGRVDVKSWSRFSEALSLREKYLGINGIGVIFNVPSNNIDNFLIQQRVLRPDFYVHPNHDGKDYWPITYVEPLKGNEQAIGLDIAFEKNRLNAARLARDSGLSHITAPIVLVQDAKKTPGFLQYVPFYNRQNLKTAEQRKKHFVGHVYAPFIMKNLIEGTLTQDKRHLVFSVRDSGALLYDELNPANPNYDPMPLHRKKLSLAMYGRTWDFTIQTAASFNNAIKTNQSTYILVGGIIIDILLITLFIILSSRNQNSLLMVDKMTKRVNDEEEYFRHIIEAAPCGMIITNDKGIIERINPQVETLFGYSRQELIGQSIDILVPKKHRADHPHHRDKFYQNKSKRRMGFDRNVYGLKKNGKEFPAEIGLAYFSGEQGAKILSTIINMTQYVDITNELKRSNKDLNDFAYVASHDLKAPLRGIMQLSSWIEEDIADIASDETKTHLALLKSRTVRLEKLLDDLLTYSRIGRHTGEINDVNVKEMTESLFQLLDPPAHFSFNVIDTVPVFRTLTIPLEVIFRNLIGNAIKHHDRDDGKIMLSVFEQDDYYEFTLSNDGPAIAVEHQEQIFEMFKTLKPRDEVEGSGMGLAVIKKILEYHGGNIRVSSQGERGVSFIFSWPKNL